MATPTKGSTTLPIRGKTSPSAPSKNVSPSSDIMVVPAQGTMTSPTQDSTKVLDQDNAATFIPGTMAPSPQGMTTASPQVVSTAHDNTTDTATEDATATSTIKSCILCPKIAAFRCSRCSEGVDTHGNNLVTDYCSKECQVSHWSVHKAECKLANARKRFYRAGQFARDLLFRARFVSWHTKLQDIEIHNDGKIHAVEVQLGEHEDVLYKFPLEAVGDDKDKEALLVYGAGEESIAMMSRILKFMLAGLVASFEEVSITLKTPARIIVRRPKNFRTTEEKSHYLLRITLKDHSTYALDLTAAQFGSGNVIMAWSIYEAAMVQDIVEVKPSHAAFKAGREDSEVKLGPGRMNDRSAQLVWMLNCLGELMMDSIKEYPLKTGMSTTDLLKTSSSEFEFRSNMFVKEIDTLLIAAVKVTQKKEELEKFKVGGYSFG